MVAFDEMAQREEIWALGQRLCSRAARLLYNITSITSITSILVTGVRKRLCDICRKFKFPFGAVCILF